MQNSGIHGLLLKTAGIGSQSNLDLVYWFFCFFFTFEPNFFHVCGHPPLRDIVGAAVVLTGGEVDLSQMD